MTACFCGCGDLPAHRHHCIPAQTIRNAHRSAISEGRAIRPLRVLLEDERNLVSVAFRCHGNHHSRARPYELRMLPDGVFVFAAELLGAGRAYNALGRSYKGSDARLDALLVEEAA